MIFKKVNYHFFFLPEEILVLIFVTNEMSHKAQHLGNFMNFCLNLKKITQNFRKRSPFATVAYTNLMQSSDDITTSGGRVLGGIKRDFCRCLWIIQFMIYLNAAILLLGRTTAKDWIHVLSRFKSSFFET